MRKLLATILAVALAMVMVLGTALADETEIATSNATITDAVNGAPEGSKLIVTVQCTEVQDSVAAGWGIGGLCVDGTWTVDGDFTSNISADPTLDEVLTFEFNLDDVKKAASGDINLNYYNGYTVTKAVLKTPAAADGGDGKADGQGGDAQGDGKGGDAPKTADTMTVVLFAGIALLALGAVVVTKKARA